MTKIINVIGSDEADAVAYARYMYPQSAIIRYINTVNAWVSLSEQEKKDILFADTQWHKKRRALAKVVTSFFKHIEHTGKHYTDPHALLKDLLPTEVKDMRIIEAHADFKPGEPPFLTMKVLMEIMENKR